MGIVVSVENNYDVMHTHMHAMQIYRKSSNKDRASDSSRDRGRYGQINAGPKYSPGVK